MKYTSIKRRHYATLATRLLILIENTSDREEIKIFHRIVTDLSQLLEPDGILVSINTDLMCYVDFRLDGDQEQAERFRAEVLAGLGRLAPTE